MIFTKERLRAQAGMMKQSFVNYAKATYRGDTLSHSHTKLALSRLAIEVGSVAALGQLLDINTSGIAAIAATALLAIDFAIWDKIVTTRKRREDTLKSRLDNLASYYNLNDRLDQIEYATEAHQVQAEFLTEINDNQVLSKRLGAPMQIPQTTLNSRHRTDTLPPPNFNNPLIRRTIWRKTAMPTQ